MPRRIDLVHVHLIDRYTILSIIRHLVFWARIRLHRLHRHLHHENVIRPQLNRITQITANLRYILHQLRSPVSIRWPYPLLNDNASPPSMHHYSVLTLKATLIFHLTWIPPCSVRMAQQIFFQISIQHRPWQLHWCNENTFSIHCVYLNNSSNSSMSTFSNANVRRQQPPQHRCRKARKHQQRTSLRRNAHHRRRLKKRSESVPGWFPHLALIRRRPRHHRPRRRPKYRNTSNVLNPHQRHRRCLYHLLRITRHRSKTSPQSNRRLHRFPRPSKWNWFWISAGVVSFSLCIYSSLFFVFLPCNFFFYIRLCVLTSRYIDGFCIVNILGWHRFFDAQSVTWTEWHVHRGEGNTLED